jgi:uncharacterized protein YndB with AHSA1/START domain
MTTVTVATTVAAPVERVFEVFTDLEHGAERVSNIQKIEVLTTAGFQLGTRWLETREVLSQLDSAEMEVTAFERNRTYTITHHKAGTRIDTVHVRAFRRRHQGSDRVRCRRPRASSRVVGATGVGHRGQGAGRAQP